MRAARRIVAAAVCASSLLVSAGVPLHAAMAVTDQEREPVAIAAAAAPAPAAPVASPSSPAASPSSPAGYVIGVDDVLSILFWRDKDLSAPDVTVRPDGKVTLPLLNDVQAAGLSPEQLRNVVLEAARKYVEDPNPTVIVKEIKSRKVFITGQVEKPGPYALNGPTTVLQLIATAGGLRDFADGKNISVMRNQQGHAEVFAFSYPDLLKKKNLGQNIVLEPGDTVVVP